MNVDIIKTAAERSIVLNDLQVLESRGYKQAEAPSQLDTVHPLTRQALSSDDDKAPSLKDLREVKLALENLPVAQVSLAVVPTTAQIEMISDWAHRVLDNNVIVDIELKRDMLAGIEISWEGVFYDGSLLKRLDEITST